jgi:IPT/TIG domain
MNRKRQDRPGGWTTRSASAALGLWLSLTLAGCGGSSGSNQPPPPPPPPEFTIVATPAAPSIAPGSSATFQVSITPQNGFSGAVAVTVSGLPSGLSAAPSSFSVQNSQQTVTLTATGSLGDGTYSLALKGTSGSLSSSTTVNVGVGALQSFLIIQPLLNQVVTRFDSTTQTQLQTETQGLGLGNYEVNFSVAGLPQGVTASFSPNPLPVGSTTTLSITAPASGQWIQNTLFNVVATASVDVPSASLTFDLSVAPAPGSIPNNRTDYLRTDDTPQSIVYDAANQQIFSSDYFLNRVDVVSTSTRQIVKSIPVLSPLGLGLTVDGSEVLVGSDTQQVEAISTSSLQIVQQWTLPRINGGAYGLGHFSPIADGTFAFRPATYGVLSGQLAIWNSTKNTTSLITLPGILQNNACFVKAGAKGTKILVTDCNSSSNAVVYDSATKTFSTLLQFPEFIYNVAASPDGSRFIISDDTYGIGLYNSQLQTTALLIPPDPFSGFIFSSDSARIYLVAGIIIVFDGSGNFINTAPAFGTIPPGEEISPSPYVETPFASDSTGIIFGSADHGIAFDDSTYAVNFAPFGFGGPPGLDLTLTPNSGPLNAATPVSFPVEIGFVAVPDIWFGSKRATQAALGGGPAGSLSATTPPSSQPGPVSAKLIQPNGVEVFNPLVFSYGPGLMFVNGDTATPNGGATSDIIGVGIPTDPSQIQVTIGGQNTNIVSAATVNFNGVYFPFGYPYPAVDVKVTLPPGAGDEDIVVTTSTGSATLAKAIHYVQGVTDYPSSDVFQSILLDRKRNQLYLSAGNHIDVFSLTALQFLAPFTPPSLNGQTAFHGLALTPDNSELLAANFPDGSVALINPDQPSSATAVQIIPPGTFGDPGPENIVTTNTGKGFIEPKSLEEAGCGGVLYELDLASLQVTTVSNISSFCIQPEGFPLAASGDGSKMLAVTTDISGPQEVAIYDAASNKWSTNNLVLENFGGNAAVSMNGSAFATGSGVLNASANLLGYLAWQDVFESKLGFSLPLEEVPDGGSLVYIAYPGSVDMFDVNHGALLHRLTLSEQVQQVTDAMAIDAYGRNLYLITSSGLTVVTLNAAPLAIGRVTPATGPAGAEVTVYGSGFQQATAVTANGLAATTSFVDPNTLLVVVPSLGAGSIQMAVTNPSGETYSLDNAFTAQ